MNPIFVFGSGAQGRVVKDILDYNGVDEIYFIDENRGMVGQRINGSEVVSFEMAKSMANDLKISLAVGNPYTRRKIVDSYKDYEIDWINVIHKNAFVANSANLGIGNTICAGSIVNSNAEVGNFCLINNGAVIEHDTILKDYCSISPRAVVGGRCVISENVFIASNATIIARSNIGKDAIVGMGSIVTRDIDDNQLAFGAPAVVKRNCSELDWKKLF
jgi:sugar O-acyltransferase (sialic acid O-acetyltransferase NeuD family)